MKCQRCGNEAALSKVCPYCGAVLSHKDSRAKRVRREKTRRTMDSGQTVVSDNDKPHSLFEWVRTFFAYVSDGSVSMYYKIAMLFMVVYIISPIDLLIDFLPIVGWLDDAAVAAVLWRFVTGELARYYKLKR